MSYDAVAGLTLLRQAVTRRIPALGRMRGAEVTLPRQNAIDSAAT